jgi:hypothetical protein
VMLCQPGSLTKRACAPGAATSISRVQIGRTFSVPFTSDPNAR